MKLKTNRGLFKTLIFSLFTCGIYTMYLIHAWAEETNTACEGDGKKTRGLIGFILLSIVTLSIYSIVWYYGLAERTNAKVVAGGKSGRITGAGYLLWSILGSFILVGPAVALYKLIHQINDSNELFNAAHAEA